MLAMIGMPRSGTTWVAKAIDSHPDTYYLHEPDSVRRMSIPNIVNEQDSTQFVPYVKDYLKTIEQVNQLKVVGRLPYFPKRYLNSVQLSFNKLSALASKAGGRFIPALAKGSPLLFRPGEGHVTFWKSIESMGRVSVLANADPQMKILLLVRHPCAVINSELKGEAAHKFASKTPIYENWGLFENLLVSDTARQHDLTIDKLKQMTPAQRLAWKWMIYYEQMLAQQDKANCMLLRYEQICTHPYDEFERILSFMGLSFDQQVVDYLQESTSSHSDSYYATSKDPRIAMHGWKTKLPQQDIDAIEQITARHLQHEYWS